ncbi:MAG TPA: aspartyl/asparaginyl beta-hydroxylase domain-containing protein [Nevskiaceae bacterium]|nr:aspartyl/asparaginyl beta-hydroxylase domain-containing protein [Nevskiaceae bacterium]
MKLPYEFCRLPLRFDAARLRAEVEALPESAWSRHPTDYAGNSAVRLISSRGEENDAFVGPMLPTAHLRACPYITQVLAGFGVVFSRSRLMQLAPGARVPPHCDAGYHWYDRVRIHIPVRTRPEVRFQCGAQTVHMAEGEAWLFDNWRPHQVLNDSPEPRIHLVADTVGSAAFWALARRGQWQHFEQPLALVPQPYQPGLAVEIATERYNVEPVMHPGELDRLVEDLLADLAAPGVEEPRPRLLAFHAALRGFAQEWRHLWSQHGGEERGWSYYLQLRSQGRAHAQAAGGGLAMRSNGLAALAVLDARILRYVLQLPVPGTALGGESGGVPGDRA